MSHFFADFIDITKRINNYCIWKDEVIHTLQS